MGRILTEALLDGKAISPSSMIITNRTISKAIAIQENYPSIQIANEISEVGKKADLIFICVKPHDVHDVAVTLKPFLTKGKCVVSITSPINVEQLESVIPCSVARVIPSITNRALSGISLLTFGQNCDEKWKTSLINLLNQISTPLEIDE